MATPIKIPGKNNRDQRRHIMAEKRKGGPSKPSGRPMKLPSHFEAAKPTTLDLELPAKSSQHRSLKTLKSRRKTSALERLPTELLLQIFFYSMNLDLPKASPVIAGKLSNGSTIIQTIIMVFRPSWEYRYEAIHGIRKDDSPGCFYDTYNESYEFSTMLKKQQSALLRYRCANITRLKKAEDNWLRQAANAKKSMKWALHRPQSLNRFFNKITDDYFDKDFEEFEIVSRTVKKNNSMGSNWCEFFRWQGFTTVHPHVEIPDSLLTGPWTEDMVKHLFWLVRANAKIDWTKTSKGEVAVSGLDEAIKSGNLQILYIFYCLRVGDRLTRDTLRWAFHNAGGNRVEVILRLLWMFMDKEHGKAAAVLHAELQRLSLAAHQQGPDASLWVEALRRRWDNIVSKP